MKAASSSEAVRGAPHAATNPIRTTGRRLRSFDSSIALLVALIAILVLLVVNPVARLFFESVQAPDTRTLTLHNFVEAYGQRRHIEALWNTLLFGLGIVVVTPLCAVPIAWAISRTDIPFKNFIRYMAFGAFILPPYLGAIGGILLAAPNAGVLNTAWMRLTGAQDGPFDIFSYAGLVLIVSMHLYFYTFTLTVSALDMISSELEDAANILGAGMVITAVKVTLPLAMPAILAA